MTGGHQTVSRLIKARPERQSGPLTSQRWGALTSLTLTRTQSRSCVWNTFMMTNPCHLINGKRHSEFPKCFLGPYK